MKQQQEGRSAENPHSDLPRFLALIQVLVQRQTIEELAGSSISLYFLEILIPEYTYTHTHVHKKKGVRQTENGVSRASSSLLFHFPSERETAAATRQDDKYLVEILAVV